MHIELTEQERQRIRQGQAVEVNDPQTNDPYILIARQRFEMSRISTTLAPAAMTPEPEIPEGIRVSQEAFRRDLPELLKQKKIFRHWVAYHRDERIGIAYHGKTLQDKCLKLGLADDEFFVGWIDASGFEVEEEVELRRHHMVEDDHEDT